jgi:hypothetical protein
MCATVEMIIGVFVVLPMGVSALFVAGLALFAWPRLREQRERQRRAAYERARSVMRAVW